MSGFLTLHRDATEHPLLLGDAARFGAWVWLVAKACWKPTKFNIGGKIVTLERGQLCVSRAQLAEAWGFSPSAVERFLTRLQTEQMIGRTTGQGKTIITICNYSKYQDKGDETGQGAGQAIGQPPDSHRTTKEQGNKVTIEEPIGSSYPPLPPQDDDEPDFGEGSDDAEKPDHVEEPDDAAKPRPAKAAKANPFPQPEWSSDQVWSDFLTNRKTKGRPNTATAYKRFLSDIARHADDEWPPGRLLEHAAAEGWAGIYDPRPKDRRNGKHGTGHGGAPRDHGPRDTRDGFQRVLDREIERGRNSGSGGEAGRWDAGPSGSYGEGPSARVVALRR